ncbi:MAG: response regulator transcription factor [Clostridia bacterium]|nr:response regulator transcription factor [Clostridia bacterium]
MKHVLVAEDEAAIREFIVINLKRSGYKVTQAEDGLQALDAYNTADEEIDIAILDIMMPGMDGLSVCKEIRSKNDNIGIIMLTAKTQEMDKITGLMMGADDYVTKPFSPSELMARVDAIYRRVSVNSKSADKSAESEYILRSGDFALNLRNRTLTKCGNPIELTQVEFQIMEYFLSNQGAALDRNDILSHVWGENYFGEDKVVDVNIRRLRMKVEEVPSNPVHLTTVWGMGYKWIT